MKPKPIRFKITMAMILRMTTGKPVVFKVGEQEYHLELEGGRRK